MILRVFLTLLALTLGHALLAQEKPDEPPIRLKKKIRPGEENRDVPGKETPRRTSPPVEKKPGPPTGDPRQKPEPPKEDLPAQDDQEVLNRIEKNMRTAQDRLAHRELNDGTEQVQDDIVKDLDQLIKRLQNDNPDSNQAPDQQPGTQAGQKPEQKQAGSSRGSSKSGLQSMRNPGRRGSRTSPQLAQGQRPRGPNRQPPGDKPGRPDQERRVQVESKPGTGNGTSQGEVNKLTEIYKEIWGHLPETLRAEMNAYGREQFMDRYSELIRQYYRTIAEKGRRKD
jgi:hypothetical protein